MSRSRVHIGTWTALALVLLRVAIGWHFYREGSAKLAYDPEARHFHIAFNAAGFFQQATGPLAEWFHAQVPNGHDWQNRLAVARKLEAPAPEGDGKAAATLPYAEWLEQITADWNALVDDFQSVAALSDHQRQQADATLEGYQEQLANYLAGLADEIAEYQHELWRLAQRRAAPESGDVPYWDERSARQAAETAALPRPWVNQVNEMEARFVDDLRNIVTADQAAEQTVSSAVDDALTSERQARLKMINLAATGLTVGVGVCLLLGFFTRIASLAGALFLLSVMATQPPWVPDAVTTVFYYQTAELAGLLVLAATGAGRWLGLDYFSYALFHKCCCRGNSSD